MSDLPHDLVEEILSRVPATSLKRLRSTCKRWNALFKKQRFSQKHFHKAPKESMILMLKEFRVCSMNVNLNVSPPYVEFQGALGIKDSHSNLGQVEIAEVFHCDGLLLCATTDNRLMVWNPCLGETRWIQRKTGFERYSRFALGFENNKSCRSYKILECWGCKDRPLGAEIYDFSSDSWKVLDGVAHDCFPTANGLSLKGNAYWIGVDKEYFSLLSFDFTSEKFKLLCLPAYCTALSVVGEEQLSVLQRIQTSKMELCVTNRVDTEADALSWSKSFTVDLPTGRSCSEVFASLLIDEERKVSLCCTLALKKTGTDMVYTFGEDKQYHSKLIPYVDKPWWKDRISEESTDKLWFPFIFNYVPSLVQIL